MEKKMDADGMTETQPRTESLPAADNAANAEEGETETRKIPRPRHNFANLSGRTLTELRKHAKELGVTGITTLRKDDLVIAVLKEQSEQMGFRFGGGTLEVLAEGYGFLRPRGLLPSDHDIYVSASQIRRFGLRNGDLVWGLIRPPKEQEHYEALLRVEVVNYSDPEEARRRPHFEKLTPIFPDERLVLETRRTELTTRVIDLFSPIGKGQRALIVSPPKAGKTTVLKNIANAVTTNQSDVILMVLLVDERPEEVTDMARSVDGEVIASTFDRPAEEHMRVAHLALEKAKRLVEVGRDVVLLLDSIPGSPGPPTWLCRPRGRPSRGGWTPPRFTSPRGSSARPGTSRRGGASR